MISPLSAKLESFLDTMQKDDDLARHGYNLLTKRAEPEQYFDALNERGFFDPENSRGPTPSETPGMVYIPFWHALEYLKVVAKRAVEKSDDALVEKLLQIMRSVTYYKDVATGEPRDNYHTYYRFAEMLGTFPLNRITLSDIQLVTVWLASKFDRGLVARELSIGLMPRLIASAAQEDVAKLCALFEECMAFQWTPEAESRSQELITVVDDYWLKELLHAHARSVGAKVGLDAILIFEKGLREIFSDKRRSYGSTLWRPAIEASSQNSGLRAAENRFVEGMRDALEGWVETAPGEARVYVVKSLQDNSEIIRRIALHMVTEHFDLLKADFEQQIGPKLFKTGHRHELYRLLCERFGEFSSGGKASTIDAIRNLPIPTKGDDRERRLKYIQRDWLSSIKDHPEVAQWFGELASDPELASLSEHPDYLSYHTTRFGPGETPFTSESIIAFAEDGTLIERLNGFTETDSWRGPTLGGLVAALEGAVGSRPRLFLSLLSGFQDARVEFQHALVQGLRNVFNLARDQQPEFNWKDAWPKLMAFFSQCMNDPRTWESAEEVQGLELLPTRPWMRSQIASFLEAATRDDETAYPEALLAQGLSIVKVLLERSPPGELSVKDAMTHALNTEKGHAVAALYNYALRACRLDKKRTDTTDAAWASVKEVFDSELAKCRNGNFEFSTLSASYLANLEFMSYPWLADNASKLFPAKEFPNNFIVALGGLAYASPSRRSYQLLASHNVFEEALSIKLEEPYARDRIIEWVSLAYLWDDERLDSPVVLKILAGGAEDLETMASFFWSVRGQQLTEKQKGRVLEFWTRCLKWANAQTKVPTQLMTRLSKLSPYLAKLDERAKALLLEVVPYVHVHYGTDNMVEELARLADSNPPAAAEILQRMLTASTPSYDLHDKLKLLIEKLAALGMRPEAISCAERASRTLPSMLELYKKLTASPQ